MHELGRSTAREIAKLEIFQTIDIMLSLQMGVGQGAGISSLFHEFESSLVQEFKLFCEFGLFFREFHESRKIHEFWVP